MRTMRELDSALPERAGHGGAVLRGGGDLIWGKFEIQELWGTIQGSNDSTGCTIT